jgi:RNA polymerase sporulation-specific sigma factor
MEALMQTRSKKKTVKKAQATKTEKVVGAKKVKKSIKSGKVSAPSKAAKKKDPKPKLKPKKTSAPKSAKKPGRPPKVESAKRKTPAAKKAPKRKAAKKKEVKKTSPSGLMKKTDTQDDIIILDPALVTIIDDMEGSEESSDTDSEVLDTVIKAIVKKVKKGSDSLGAVFDISEINDPLVGTPSEVRTNLDNIAIYLQKNPKDQEAFLKIVTYMHKYILGLVFKKFSFVRGYDVNDMYQESLIALFKKAVPSFKKGKGMSFLNFAKMCINRHLITILHASKHRRKDIPMNTAISLDQSPVGNGDEDSCPLSNVISDTGEEDAPFSEMSRSETFQRTLATLSGHLSEFEQIVLAEYLDDKSYRDAAESITECHGLICNEKSIDNALLRIRKKASELREEGGPEEDLPLLF